MELGMIGLGRMGANMVRRLMRAGHTCVVYDLHPQAVQGLVGEGAVGSASMPEFVQRLHPPRTAWMMVPAAVVDRTLDELTPLLQPGDAVVDGGNSHYHEDIRRARALEERGLHYVDVGVSGGIWGVDRGFCLMIGGEDEVVRRLDPVFSALAPGIGAAPRTPGREAPPRPAGAPAPPPGAAPPHSTAEQGYLHCGQAGAGHFVKMVHNGIEYGLMAAYAEGLNILRHANAGKHPPAADAETAPLRHPEYYQYDMPLADVAEVWRRGSVISSWLLDLTAHALYANPDLQGFAGRVSDSGEGRWTLAAAIDESAPASVLAAALFDRFASRGESDFADRLLSAMRFEFGGHVEMPTGE